MPKEIKVKCLRLEVEDGNVRLPEEGSNACALPLDTETPVVKRVNVRDLPRISCIGCRIDAIVRQDSAPLILLVATPPTTHPGWR